VAALLIGGAPRARAGASDGGAPQPRVPAVADSAVADSMLADSSVTPGRVVLPPPAPPSTEGVEPGRGGARGGNRMAAGPGTAREPVADGTFDQPRWVMLRSLVIPGWGQWHNRAFVKSAAFAGVEGWLGARLVRDGRSLDRLRGDVEAARSAGDDARAAEAVQAYNRRLDRFVAGQWMLAGVVTYALLDAYVDAHFRHFKVEFEHDPALPAGFSTGTGARLLLRWGF
jgi:hypothetical protein